MTNFIVLIITGLVFIFVAICILIAIVKKWPLAGLILGIIFGVIIGIWIHWIAGVIFGLISFGWLSEKAKSLTKECSNCKSHDTELIETASAEGKRIEMWKCNKCGKITQHLEL